MASIEEICEVLKAHADGKVIQTRDVYGDWTNISVDVYAVSYLKGIELRIKPEPRELWIVFWNDGTHTYCNSEKEAGEWVTSPSCAHFKGVVVKFREVLDGSE